MSKSKISQAWAARQTPHEQFRAYVIRMEPIPGLNATSEEVMVLPDTPLYQKLGNKGKITISGTSEDNGWGFEIGILRDGRLIRSEEAIKMGLDDMVETVEASELREKLVKLVNQTS